MDIMKEYMTASHQSEPNQPDHKIIDKRDGYEERRYTGGTWVCTDVLGLYHEQARIEGFRRLQGYIAGQNQEGIQMLMSVPILTKLSPNNMAGFENTFTVCMYVVLKPGAHAPVPTCEKVYVQELPAMTVFVKRFNGVTNDEKWICEAKDLAETLRDKKEFHTDFYFTAGYNSPYSLVHKTNEVWLVQNVLDEITVPRNQTVLPAVESNSASALIHTVLPASVSSSLPPPVLLLLTILLSYVQFVKACFYFTVYSAKYVTESNTMFNLSVSTVGFGVDVMKYVHQAQRKASDFWTRAQSFCKTKLM